MITAKRNYGEATAPNPTADTEEQAVENEEDFAEGEE